MIKGGCIYILTNVRNTTLYVGVTSDLVRRVHEHRSLIHPKSFTSRYNLYKLVYYEVFPRIQDAITREKQIKDGSRKKKEELINSINPEWKDLLEELIQIVRNSCDDSYVRHSEDNFRLRLLRSQ